MSLLDVPIIPVSAEIFDDTIDGYFPLVESIRQMMARRHFGAVLINIAQAPIMDIPGLAPQSPVPLRIASGTVGLIYNMHLLAIKHGDRVELKGMGDWRWFNDEPSQPDQFDPLTRLAEPAYLSGIGLHKGSAKTMSFGWVKIVPQSGVAIAGVRGDAHDLAAAHAQPNCTSWMAAEIFDVPNGQKHIILRAAPHELTNSKSRILKDIIDDLSIGTAAGERLLVRPQTLREANIVAQLRADGM